MSETAVANVKQCFHSFNCDVSFCPFTQSAVQFTQSISDLAAWFVSERVFCFISLKKKANKINNAAFSKNNDLILILSMKLTEMALKDTLVTVKHLILLCVVFLVCPSYVLCHMDDQLSVAEHKHVHCSHEHPKADEVKYFSSFDLWTKLFHFWKRILRLCFECIYCNQSMFSTKFWTVNLVMQESGLH